MELKVQLIFGFLGLFALFMATFIFVIVAIGSAIQRWDRQD